MSSPFLGDVFVQVALQELAKLVGTIIAKRWLKRERKAINTDSGTDQTGTKKRIKPEKQPTTRLKSTP
jgi:hypothetical protein